MNNLEQKSFENFVEIVGVPKINNEDCKSTAKKNCFIFKLES